ncbi:unnamed protein product [Ectocarpus sp. 4 AP-2014]
MFNRLPVSVGATHPPTFPASSLLLLPPSSPHAHHFPRDRSRGHFWTVR